MNNQVAQQCKCAENEHGNGQPVSGLSQTLDSCAFGDSSFTVSCCQGESSSASTDLFSRVGADQNLVNAHTSEISSADASGIKSAWSGSCPCGELSGLGHNGEGVSGGQFHGTQPADNDGAERVVNGDTFGSENYLGANQENPSYSSQSCCVEDTNCCIGESSSDVKASGSQDTNKYQDAQVNPTGSRAVNVSFGHVPNATSAKSEILNDLLAKKGN